MKFRAKMKKTLANLLYFEKYQNLNASFIELNNITELKKVFGWTQNPQIDDEIFFKFETICDINERRIRDAESVGCVMCNSNPKIALEIGTSDGHTTALMALNAQHSKIYTINILPEEIILGKGGQSTGIPLERDKIGVYYKERGFGNIAQIYANTATWTPNIGTIDFVFIDGCHDTEFVYNDTYKVIQHMKSGSFILWHDFNPTLIKKFSWIDGVCSAIEMLYEDRILKGPVYLIKDSWTGIYRVG
jgi:hypothetical protein